MAQLHRGHSAPVAARFSKKLSGCSDRINKGHILFQAPQSRNISALEDHFALSVSPPQKNLHLTIAVSL